MFYTQKHKQQLIELDLRVARLKSHLERLESTVERHDTTISALLKILTNRAKLDAEKSSVTVTVHAPHGLKKDGTPKKKPGPKRGDF